MRDCYCPGQGRRVRTGSINDASWETDMIGCGSEKSPVVLSYNADLYVFLERERQRVHPQVFVSILYLFEKFEHIHALTVL